MSSKSATRLAQNSSKSSRKPAQLEKRLVSKNSSARENNSPQKKQLSSAETQLGLAQAARLNGLDRLKAAGQKNSPYKALRAAKGEDRAR